MHSEQTHTHTHTFPQHFRPLTCQFAELNCLGIKSTRELPARSPAPPPSLLAPSHATQKVVCAVSSDGWQGPLLFFTFPTFISSPLIFLFYWSAWTMNYAFICLLAWPMPGNSGHTHIHSDTAELLGRPAQLVQ